MCILGDLNFECDDRHLGFVTFGKFANDYGIVSCDDLMVGDLNYTYHHDSLQHKSLIDHVFMLGC